MDGNLEYSFVVHLDDKPNSLAPSGLENREEVNEYMKTYVRFFEGDTAEYSNLKGDKYQKTLVDTKRKWTKHQGYDRSDKFNNRRLTDDWNYFGFPNITINFFIEAILIYCSQPHLTVLEKSSYRVISMNFLAGGSNEYVVDIAPVGPAATSESGWDGSIHSEIRLPIDVAELGSVPDSAELDRYVGWR